MHKSTNNFGSHKENPAGIDNLLFRLSDFNKKPVEVGFSIE